MHKAVLFLAHVEFKEMGEHETKGEFYEKRITTKEFKEGCTVKTCHIYGFDDYAAAFAPKIKVLGTISISG